jgi:hypothetical protein
VKDLREVNLKIELLASVRQLVNQAVNLLFERLFLGGLGGVEVTRLQVFEFSE